MRDTVQVLEEYNEKYYQKNKAKFKKEHAEYRKNNRDSRMAYSVAYHKKHPKMSTAYYRKHP